MMMINIGVNDEKMKIDVVKSKIQFSDIDII